MPISFPAGMWSFAVRHGSTQFGLAAFVGCDTWNLLHPSVVHPVCWDGNGLKTVGSENFLQKTRKLSMSQLGRRF